MKGIAMNEVYDDILGKVLRLKSTDKIAIQVEQGKFQLKLINENVGYVCWFVVVVMDAYTMRPYSYMFTSKMSDDELEDTLSQIIEKLNLLRNLNCIK